MPEQKPPTWHQRSYAPTIAGIDPDTPIVFMEDDRRYYRPQVLLVTDEDRVLMKAARDREEHDEQRRKLFDQVWVKFTAVSGGIVLLGQFVLGVIHTLQGK